MTGVKQRFYGYAAMGASPTIQKRMRAVLANAGGYRKAGGCTTTAFVLAGLTSFDPWVEFPLETIVEFLIAHVNSGMKVANEQAWKQKLPDMQKGARWSRVYGSLSAAMASLIDAGFEVPSIHHWIDPSGGEWCLDFSEPMFTPAVREVLQHFLTLGVWGRAQNHVFGSSLGLRPDLRPGKSRIRQAKKQQKWQELYFLEAIMQ